MNFAKYCSVLALLVLLAAAASFAESKVIVGSSCNFTYQCGQGYCDNSSKTCIVPSMEDYSVVGNCSTSRNCSQGFCVADKCLIPKANVTRFVVVGPKQGCAGLIEFCTPVIPFCYQLCESMWILLAATALVAGVAARKEKNKLVPLALMIIPLVVGVMSFAFIGVLVAIAEIMLTAYRTGKEKTGLEEVEFKQLTLDDLAELPGEEKTKKQEKE
ncbi:hypothetical protein HY992_02340 [Candidatus Micrarchaeota archaeon]|nr:hypothetical protein [Candidatus Micrarchaeota archaeon]